MAFYCPACLPPTNPCLIYLTLTIKPKGVIHSHLSAALLKHGGELPVGTSRPLYRSSATLSYLHLSFHETFDIIILSQTFGKFGLPFCLRLYLSNTAVSPLLFLIPFQKVASVYTIPCRLHFGD